MVGVTGGLRVIVAEAVLVGSAELAAVMVTVWRVMIEAGAVYKPAAETDPVCGLMLHVTAVLL